MSNLDSIQVEQLKHIGAQLHQLREEQSRPLEEIAALTYIPLRLLRAIEVGQTEILPEPVFIQGFIRRYADELGLDGTVLSKQFSINTFAVNALSTSTRTSDLPPVRSKSAAPKKAAPSPRPNLIFMLPFITGIVIIGSLVFGINQWMKQLSSEPRTPSLPSPAQTPKPIASPSKATTPSPTTAASPTRSPSAVPIQAELSLSGDSWLQIKVDGKTEFEGILRGGETRQWSAKQTLTVVAGNAGVVSLSVNGGAAKVMGAPGSVQQVTLTPTSLQPSPSL